MDENFYGEIDKQIFLTKKIGSGGTSKVFLGYKKDSPSTLYAVKVIKSLNTMDSKFFTNEITMLQKVNHPNVVKLINGGDGVLTKENGKKEMIQYLILELITYGELFDFIFFPQKGFGEYIGKYIFLQILDGLEACHKNGIVHRDMKTENIMLDNGWIPKIADFGFATKAEGKKGNGLLYTALGTASYASPELLQKKPYLGIQSDIFSLGVSLFVIVTGKMPFKHALIDDPYYKEIVKRNYTRYWEKLSSKIPSISSDFQEFFVSLIAYDPNTRPSLSEIRNSKWLFDYVYDENKVNDDFSKRLQVVKTKKEQERRLEEEQKKQIQVQGNKFNVYKDGEAVEYENTVEGLNLNSISNENYEKNPYILLIKNEDEPGKLVDYIFSKLIKLNGVDVRREKESYKLIIGCNPLLQSEDFELGGDFVIDPIEIIGEVKKREEGELVVEFTKANGNKYDFIRLFSEIEKIFN